MFALTNFRPVFGQLLRGEGLLVDQIRSRMRFPFRFPTETKRYRKNSYYKMIAKPTHKYLMMRKILNGKIIISHI